MNLAFAFVATTSVFFVFVAAAFLWEGSTAPTRRMRNLAWLAAGLSLQFATGAAWSAGIEAANVGWISADSGELLETWLGLLVEVMALGFGVAALVVLARSDSALHKAERMTSILSSRVARANRDDDLHLTAREVQVLELLAEGHMTDAALSRELSVSSATAATHVRNIMAKAEVHRRQDLVLLAAGGN